MPAREITNALLQLRPGARWKLDGDVYAGLTWLDQVQTKPTEAEVDAMVATQAATQATEDARIGGIAGDPRTIAMVQRLRNASAQQIDDYVTNNVTNLAQARVALADIIKILALHLQLR